MYKTCINETEFDSLPEQSQMRYLYCTKCKCYYLTEKNAHHLCEEDLKHEA
jgi:hypothetical protein